MGFPQRKQLAKRKTWPQLGPSPLSPFFLFFVLFIAPLAPAQPSSEWLYGAYNLTQPVWHQGATTVGQVGLFAGGFTTADSAISTVFVYNLTNHSWSQTTLSLARGLIAATTVGGVALFAGGVTGNYSNYVTSAQVDLFDSTTGQWSTATLSLERAWMAATSVGELAIFGGGWSSSSTTPNGYSAVVDIYNSSSGLWSTSSLSQERGYLAAATVAGLAIFAGGYNDADYATPRVDMFNLTSRTWSTTTLSLARYGLSGVTAAGGVVMFAGGAIETSTQYLSTARVDIYNALTAEWTTASLSVARYYIAATSVGDMTLFAGGFSNYSESFNNVDLYNTTSAQWSK